MNPQSSLRERLAVRHAPASAFRLVAELVEFLHERALISPSGLTTLDPSLFRWSDLGTLEVVPRMPLKPVQLGAVALVLVHALSGSQPPAPAADEPVEYALWKRSILTDLCDVLSDEDEEVWCRILALLNSSLIWKAEHQLEVSMFYRECVRLSVFQPPPVPSAAAPRKNTLTRLSGAVLALTMLTASVSDAAVIRLMVVADQDVTVMLNEAPLGEDRLLNPGRQRLLLQDGNHFHAVFFDVYEDMVCTWSKDLQSGLQCVPPFEVEPIPPR